MIQGQGTDGSRGRSLPGPGDPRGLNWGHLPSRPLGCPPPPAVHTSLRTEQRQHRELRWGPEGSSGQPCPRRHTHQLPAPPAPEAPRAPSRARAPSTRTHADSHLRTAELPAPLYSAASSPRRRLTQRSGQSFRTSRDRAYRGMPGAVVRQCRFTCMQRSLQVRFNWALAGGDGSQKC